MRGTMSSAMHDAATERESGTGHAPTLVVWSSLWPPTLGAMLGETEQRARFSYALQRAMKHRGISARALAKAIEVDARIVAKWLAGKGLPNLYESQRLAAALQVDENLFKNPPPTPPPPVEPPYPLAEYLLGVGQEGAGEGHRRASTPQRSPARGTRSRTPEPRARASGE